jgi:hypothetical protein
MNGTLTYSEAIRIGPSLIQALKAKGLVSFQRPGCWYRTDRGQIKPDSERKRVSLGLRIKRSDYPATAEGARAYRREYNRKYRDLFRNPEREKSCANIGRSPNVDTR